MQDKLFIIIVCTLKLLFSIQSSLTDIHLTDTPSCTTSNLLKARGGITCGGSDDKFTILSYI